MTRALPYVLAVGVLVALVWHVSDLAGKNASLALAVEAADRERAVAVDIADQARFSRDVAKAAALRNQERSDKLANVERWINANDDDAPMPDILRGVFDQLLGQAAN